MSACALVRQGIKPGSCLVELNGRRDLACKLTYKVENGVPYRLVFSYAHKAPECYLSIYQSGCNWSCKKCHSWYFTRYARGEWMSPRDIARVSLRYYVRNRDRMYYEPRERVTSWHAAKLCRACGSCVLLGVRSKYCPRKLSLDNIVLLDDKTWGPARNIISFTGGDLACQIDFYVESTKEIKALGKNLWVMFETNGYGLTPKHLDMLKDAGLDSFWLDIKAYDDKVHRLLTGASNENVLKLPAEIMDRDFVLEVSTVYIPGWVEEDQIKKIAELLAQVDQYIPYSIIAFIPEYQLIEIPPPTFKRMVNAFFSAKDAGLKNVKLGNLGLFVRSEEELDFLAKIDAI